MQNIRFNLSLPVGMKLPAYEKKVVSPNQFHVEIELDSPRPDVSMTKDPLWSLYTLKELKNLCNDHDLPNKGTKTQLLQILRMNHIIT
jgi:hypothetical protein